MILVLSVVAAISVALARGGRLSRLTEARLERGWMAIFAFIMQVLVMRLGSRGTEGALGPRALLAGSYLLLLAVVLANRRLPGILLVAVGLGLNLSVMLVNGGYMPITPGALEKAGLASLAAGNAIGARVLSAKDVLLPAASTRLWILSDVIVIPPPLGTAFSIGDVILSLGGFRFFGGVMLGPKSKGAPIGAAQTLA